MTNDVTGNTTKSVGIQPSIDIMSGTPPLSTPYPRTNGNIVTVQAIGGNLIKGSFVSTTGGQTVKCPDKNLVPPPTSPTNYDLVFPCAQLTPGATYRVDVILLASLAQVASDSSGQFNAGP
jgi:hypothetical protein